MENLRYYYDTEHNELYYIDDFLEEYLEAMKERQVEEIISFQQYLNNCLTINNGTLELIMAKDMTEAMEKVKEMHKHID